MDSVKYDTVELVNTTYNMRFAQHDSMPERFLSTQKLTREDGVLIVSDTFGSKRILVRGTLVGTSQSDLDDKIDALKELIARKDKNLDISYGGSTRRYIARAVRCDIERDHFHIDYTPYEIEFIVPSGIGRDTSTTTAYDDNVVTTTEASDAVSFSAGSAPPKPKITIESQGTWSFIEGFEFKNTDNGHRIIVPVPSGFSVFSGHFFRIYCEEKKVTYQQGASVPEIEVDFYGQFPEFAIGANNWSIKLGNVYFERYFEGDLADLTTSTNIDSSNDFAAQSFRTPYAEATYKGCGIIVDKTGTPPNDLTIRIETDNDGEPSGTLAHANAEFTIAESDVSGTRTFIDGLIASSGTVFELAGNTVYWIVLKSASTDGSNHYDIYNVAENQYVFHGEYTRGKRMFTSNGGTTWTDVTGSQPFRMIICGSQETSDVDVTMEYNPRYL